LSSVPPPERIAVVTGTSSGIGEAVALRLGRAGWRVLAGVRRQEDAERLEDRGLQPVWLDVTDADSIAAAAVELGERPLAGLVNNAGVAVSMPLELLPLDELRRQLEINLVGQVAVTQAFLPALRRGRGRLVFVGSIAGRSALPFLGAYAASKHALEAVTDSLRIELRPLGSRSRSSSRGRSGRRSGPRARRRSSGSPPRCPTARSARTPIDSRRFARRVRRQAVAASRRRRWLRRSSTR
jgi:NAD(P)-dependent dehydrogenase (short-subunit alcohol dehydrogenase family)